MPKRQLRVGNQWLYAGDAEKLLKEAIRIREEEEAQHRLSGHHVPWIRKYVFSTDHKWIGVQYGITALFFLLFGFSLMLLMRLQLGAPDMAFPKLNMASYWCFLPGGLIMLASFAAPGGTANSGWTSYPPLSDI